MSTALIATAIFIAVLVLLLSDRMDRTIVALVGASLMIGVGSFSLFMPLACLVVARQPFWFC